MLLQILLNANYGLHLMMLSILICGAWFIYQMIWGVLLNAEKYADVFLRIGDIALTVAVFLFIL